MNKRTKWIVQRHERTALGLLDRLSPISGVVAAAGDDPQTFIYRGVGSAAYGLIPAAFRGRHLLFPDRRPVSERTNHNQIWAEIVYLSEFIKVADSRGLRIPEDSFAFRSTLAKCQDSEFFDDLLKGEAVWPPDCLLSAMGLAQHYGVPTRLLDWSRSPYAAAYFAAMSAIQGRQSGLAVIWAFDTDLFEFNTFDNFKDWQQHVRLAFAPGSDIPNLQAQQGIFMLGRDLKFQEDDTFSMPPYEELLVTQFSVDRTRPVLYRLTFPAKEAPDLLRLLSNLGVDGSSLFPGHAGAAQAVKERLLWPAPGSKYETRAARAARLRSGRGWT